MSCFVFLSYTSHIHICIFLFRREIMSLFARGTSSFDHAISLSIRVKWNLALPCKRDIIIRSCYFFLHQREIPSRMMPFLAGGTPSFDHAISFSIREKYHPEWCPSLQERHHHSILLFLSPKERNTIQNDALPCKRDIVIRSGFCPREKCQNGGPSCRRATIRFIFQMYNGHKLSCDCLLGSANSRNGNTMEIQWNFLRR